MKLLTCSKLKHSPCGDGGNAQPMALEGRALE